MPGLWAKIVGYPEGGSLKKRGGEGGRGEKRGRGGRQEGGGGRVSVVFWDC